MAVRRWVGRQGAVAQIDTLTPAGVSVGSTFTVTINNKSVTFTATAATVANVTAGLVAALGASLYPEFAEVTWADGATAITATGPDTGAPFTATVAAGGTGSPTFGTATTTSPTGPNWWGVAANWKEGSAPATGDDVTIDEGPSILYGLDQSAVTLASLTVTPNFPQASEIGLPRNTSPQNPDQGYPEYRPQRLKIGVTVATVDTVSGRVRLDLDTDASTVTVDGTGTAVAPGEWPLDLVGVNTATAVRVNRGTVGLAANAGDAMTVGTLKVAYRTQRDGDAVVELGVGLTVGTSVEQSGGAVTLRTAVPTYTKEGGTLLREGSGALTTMLNRIGEFQDAGTGTITALTQGGTYRRTGLAALTVTDCTLLGGSVTRDPLGVVAWTNPVQLYECSLSGGADDDTPPQGVAYFDCGRHRKLTVANI
jgi:hypothetical protein